MDLASYITAVPNHPKPGITFRDITPLLSAPNAMRRVVQAMRMFWFGKVDAIAGLDARGFLFGPSLAMELGVPFVMVRKKGKLPGKTVSCSYELEYGTDTIEMIHGVIQPGMRVLVLDDLLATGGTAAAACKLVESVGGHVAGCAFVIELVSLNGRSKLSGVQVQSLVSFE